MDLNQGRFLVNGKSGYILKPAYLRDRATEFDPITLTRGDWLKHKTLHIMVRLVVVKRNFIQLQAFELSDMMYLHVSSGYIGPAAPESEQEEVLHCGPGG